MLHTWHFDTSYARLPESFFSRCKPVPVRSPCLKVFNHKLATSLGLSALGEDAAIFSGNTIPEGAEPIALAYAGHQFGHLTMLGDGRAVLLGEHVTDKGRFDIQLKGSGKTPFSRGGDGRAALGPMLREYIISEAMHYLGIPTTRSLAVVTTGESVFREVPLPGAVLTRVASSHIRIGTFEYAARTNGIQEIADYTIRRHYPECLGSRNPYLALLQAVTDKQAALVAQWVLVGFVHGVINTDNVALSGETIDYGPCAFIDTYNPNTVFSSIDHNGRYAYGNQSRVMQWNLARFAETLLPHMTIHEAQNVVASFQPLFQNYWLAGMSKKLGLAPEEAQDTIEELLQLMQGHDYTNTFRALSDEQLPDAPLFREAAFTAWHKRWQKNAQLPLHNPMIIPRNHVVEKAIEAAVKNDDFTIMETLLKALETPYGKHDEYHGPTNSTYRTFCGT